MVSNKRREKIYPLKQQSTLWLRQLAALRVSVLVIVVLLASIDMSEAVTPSDAVTVTSTGKYWYRVTATNANGDSLGTNEVLVRVK